MNKTVARGQINKHRQTGKNAKARSNSITTNQNTLSFSVSFFGYNHCCKRVSKVCSRLCWMNFSRCSRNSKNIKNANNNLFKSLKSSRESTKITAWAISPQAGCNDDRQNIWQTSTVFILYDKLFLNCLNTCTTAEVWISNERRKPEKYKSLRQSTFLHIQLFHGSHGIKTNLLFVSSTWPAF